MTSRTFRDAFLNYTGRSAGEIMSTIWESLLDLIFPPPLECPFCKVPTDSANTCHECTAILSAYQDEERCRLCGRFLEDALPAGKAGTPICADCSGSGRPFTRAMAPAPYDGIIKETIHRFKYNGERHLAAPLAELMVGQLKQQGLAQQGADLLLAIPLSYDKLLQRGFNQAALLAEEISQITAIPFEGRILEKVKDTPAQTSLPRVLREINLYGAFRVTDEKGLSARKVLLIDDVFTTGSTVSAAAGVLKAAGAAQVYVLTAATARSRR